MFFVVARLSFVKRVYVGATTPPDPRRLFISLGVGVIPPAQMTCNLLELFFKKCLLYLWKVFSI